MSRKKYADVVIIVEHLSRELESALLLESSLGARGITSLIVFRGWDEGPATCFERPKVVVTPYCYDDTDVETLKAYKGGFIDGSFEIVDLHSEQITSADGLSFVLPTGAARDTVHICWGEFFERALLESGINDSRVFTTGSNRLDLFRDEYRYLSATKDELASEFGLDATKPWVLFIGNYSAAFLADDWTTELESRGLTHVRENIEITKTAYASALRWMEEALNDPDLSGAEFIYRPHPSEPITSELSELERGHKKLHVIKKHAIRDWFFNVDVGLTWCSTSSVEAAYSNLPVFVLRPFEIPEHLQFKLLENIEHVDSSYEMRRVIKDAINGSLEAGVNERFKDSIDFYYAKGQVSATEQITDIIQSLVKAENGSFTTARRALYVPKKCVNYAAKQIIYSLGLAKRFPSLKILSDDHITKRELEDMRRRING